MPITELRDFHLKMVPEFAQEKHGFERVIRAVINYVRAVASIEDYEALGMISTFKYKSNCILQILVTIRF